MTRNKQVDVLLIHNMVSPYRLPIFEEINKYVNLSVWFCELKNKDRKWNTSMGKYTFLGEVLKNFNLGPFVVNYEIFFKLLFQKFDLYIVGENFSNFFTILFSLIFSKIYKKPFVLWSEAIENKFFKKNNLIQNIKYNLIYIYRKLIYSQVDHFIAYSEMSKKYLCKMGVDKSKIFVGEQVMPKELLKNVSINKSTTKYKDKKIILSLGYLKKGKGLDCLIESYKRIKAKETLLIIAGSGPEEKYLKTLCNGREDIHFVGYVKGKDKFKYYDIADIFVLPTLYDAWGLVINEAMYYGLPIITTKAAGAAELIYKNNNGFVIEPSNTNELKIHLEKLINNDILRQEMSNNSKGYGDAVNANKGVKPFIEAIDHYFEINMNK